MNAQITEREWTKEYNRIKDLIPFWESIPHPQALVNATFIKHVMKAFDNGDRSENLYEFMRDIRLDEKQEKLWKEYIL